MGAYERPRKVGVDYVFYLLSRECLDGGAREHGGIVHQNINTTEVRHGGFDHAIHITLLRDIRPECDCLVPCRDELLGSFLRRLARSVVVHHEPAATRRQYLGNSFTDAFCTAGNEGNFASEIHEKRQRSA